MLKFSYPSLNLPIYELLSIERFLGTSLKQLKMG